MTDTKNLRRSLFMDTDRDASTARFVRNEMATPKRPSNRRTRHDDGWRPLVSKIGVGVLTGMLVAGLTYVVWEIVTLPHRADLHEWIFRFHGLWPK